MSVTESFQFNAEASERLDQFLARASGQSRAFVQRHIDEGRVRVNGQIPRKAGEKLKAGDCVTGAFAAPPPSELAPEKGDLDILFEDEELLALNKPQGVAVHPAPGHRTGTVVHFLLHHLKDQPFFHSPDSARPGIVHRLDLGTSGVLVIAKTRRAQEGLSGQFKSRTIKKQYECLAWGDPGSSGRIELPIGRHRIDRKRMSSRSTKTRDALTDWQRISRFSNVTHLALFPRTGRTHQLRVHLSESGHPIVGDSLYMRRSAQGWRGKLRPEVASFVDTIKHPFLHAKRLTLSHPVSGETLVFEAPHPAAFSELLTMLRKFDT